MIEKLIKNNISYFEKRGELPELASYMLGLIWVIFLSIIGLVSLIVNEIISMINWEHITAPHLLNPAVFIWLFIAVISSLTLGKIFNIMFNEFLFILLPAKHRQRIYNEVRAYLEQIEPDRFHVSGEFHTRIERFPRYDDLDVWLNKWGKSRSFRNLAHKRCDKNLNFYNTSLLKWSFYIPMERLSEDQRLDLLKMNYLNEEYDSETTIFAEIEKLFENYSPKQIVNLYYSSFNAEYYIKVLLTSATKIKEIKALPVFKRMKDLISYVESLGEKPYPKEALPIEGDCSLGYVEHIKNYSSLVKAAQDFSNCLKSYNSYCNQGLYSVYRVHSEEPIVFHVNPKGSILEIKYKANRVVNREDRAVISGHIKSRMK